MSIVRATTGRTNMPEVEMSSASAFIAPRIVPRHTGHSTTNRRVARGGGGLIVTFASRAAVSSAVSWRRDAVLSSNATENVDAPVEAEAPEAAADEASAE